MPAAHNCPLVARPGAVRGVYEGPEPSDRPMASLYHLFSWVRSPATVLIIYRGSELPHHGGIKGSPDYCWGATFALQAGEEPNLITAQLNGCFRGV